MCNFCFLEMGKFMKPGKVVMVLAGRYAGRKAVIVKVTLLQLMSHTVSMMCFPSIYDSVVSGVVVENSRIEVLRLTNFG